MNIDIVYLLIVIITVIISMTFHEAMHAFVGYWLGDDTAKLQGRLTLNPIKHIDPFLTLFLPIMLAIVGAPVFGGARPVPFNPNKLRFEEWGVALVAIAGPLINLFIAFISFGLWILIGNPGQGILGQIFITIVSVNLGFFIFNLIPFPPLDGSRVLYALAPEFVRRGMEIVEKFGIIIIFAIILFSGNLLEIFMINSINFFITFFGNVFGL